MKDFYVLPNNDAEAYRIQILLDTLKNDGFEIEYAITGQPQGANTEHLERDIKAKVQEKLDNNENIYYVEITGNTDSRITSIDHHNKQNSKTCLEQIADKYGKTLTTLDKMVAANDVGFIDGMINEGLSLGLTNEEISKYVQTIDKMETMMKIPQEIDQPRKKPEQILGLSELANEKYKANKLHAKEAIRNAYVYDNRFAQIEINDFNIQRDVSIELYEQGKRKNACFENYVISSIDSNNNHRLVYFGSQENAQMLKDVFQDYKTTWIGGKEPNKFFGVQLADNEDLETAKKLLRTTLEEKVLGYHQIIDQKDILTTAKTTKYGNDLKIHRIMNPEAFRNAMLAAQNANSHSAFVHVYDTDEYSGNKLFVVNAGCAGCIVTPSGDIESVFKNDIMAKSDDVEKISTALLLTAVDNGGQKLDCFDGFLPGNYMKHGFEPVAKVRFNDEFAPDGQNFERDGRPDIIFFKHNGDKSDEILEKRANQSYDGFNKNIVTEKLNSLPFFNDYDEAAAYRDSLIDSPVMTEKDAIDQFLFQNTEFEKVNNMTNEKMTTACFMIGVEPGYLGKNPTPDEALKRATPSIYKRLAEMEHPINKNDIDIKPAAAIYREIQGCPEGGEVGVVVTTKIRENELNDMRKQVGLLMADLGQSTCTVEYDTNGQKSSDYIENTYENNKPRSENTLISNTVNENTVGAHFRIEFDKNINGGIQQIGSRLQPTIELLANAGDNINKINQSDKLKPYVITGIAKEENGNIIFEGTQNPMFATDNKKYIDTLRGELIQSGLKPINGMIEINGVKEPLLSDNIKGIISDYVKQLNGNFFIEKIDGSNVTIRPVNPSSEYDYAITTDIASSEQIKSVSINGKEYDAPELNNIDSKYSDIIANINSLNHIETNIERPELKITDNSIGDINFYEVEIPSTFDSQEAIDELQSKLENLAGKDNVEAFSETQFIINKDSITEKGLNDIVRNQEQSKPNSIAELNVSNKNKDEIEF